MERRLDLLALISICDVVESSLTDFAVRFEKLRQKARRYFELYGSFPDAREGNTAQPGWVGNYQAVVEFADGEIGLFDTVGESENQINIALHLDHRRCQMVSATGSSEA